MGQTNNITFNLETSGDQNSNSYLTVAKLHYFKLDYLWQNIVGKLANDKIFL